MFVSAPDFSAINLSGARGRKPPADAVLIYSARWPAGMLVNGRQPVAGEIVNRAEFVSAAKIAALYFARLIEVAP